MGVPGRTNNKKFYLYDNVAGRFIEIKDGYVCGRLEGELQFPEDKVVSRKQCQFFIHGNDVYIEDLGSTNRTRVNSVPSESGHRRRIQLYDVIEFGSQRLTLSHQNRFPPNVQDKAGSKKFYKAARRGDGQLTSTIPREDLTKRTLVMLDRATFRRLRLEETFGSRRRDKNGDRRSRSSRAPASRGVKIGAMALVGVTLLQWLVSVVSLGWMGALDKEMPNESSEIVLLLAVMASFGGLVGYSVYRRFFRRVRNPWGLVAGAFGATLVIIGLTGLLSFKSGVVSRASQNLAVARCIKTWDDSLCRRLAHWERDEWVRFPPELRTKIEIKVRH